ncbi:MAG: ATP-binding protein [Vicinamibacteria bacterium]
MGETRVDLLHLLEDLRDAYAGALEETILTEIVANALDSGARSISIRTDPSESVLVVVDDGRGMTRRELGRYHDIAASSKTRGEGIGFAGVGIKLGLLACEEVLTETRKGTKQIATRWKLASRHRAPWRWVDPPGVVTGPGTGVCLRLRNPLSPLLDEGFIETTLRQHFEPLLDTRFDAALAEHYPEGVAIRLNGRALEKAAEGEGAAFDVVLPRKRRPCAHGVLWRSSVPLPEDRRGVAISTLGKVIRRGWDWLGLTPLAPDHVGGLIEAPVLAEALTLNKADFLRSGARGMLYLGVRKAIQQAVGGQLRAWGEGRDPEEEARRRAARPLERDLEAVLVDLTKDFPALAPLVERRAGGQTRLPGGGDGGSARSVRGVDGAREREAAARDSASPSDLQPAPESGATPEAAEPSPAEAPAPLDERAPLDGGTGRSPQRYRLTIEFEQREDLPDIGRLSQSTVFVNTAHAAYRRALASRSEGYHVALSVAMALAPEVAEPAGARAFIAAFLESWGHALSRDKRRRGARS